MAASCFSPPHLYAKTPMNSYPSTIRCDTQGRRAVANRFIAARQRGFCGRPKKSTTGHCQVLFIPEILHNVFAQLFPDEGEADAEGRQALARSARVCQTFHHAAVRVLWRRVSIVPFLRLCSSFTLEEDIRPDCGTYAIYSLTENIPTHERDRLIFYGRHVRTLWCKPPPGARQWWVVKTSTWVFLQNALQDASLCRNLKELHWEFDTAAPHAVLRCLSPSIRELRLSGHKVCNTFVTVSEWEASLEGFFRALVNWSQQLEGLQLDVPNAIFSFSEALSPIHGLRSLRDLDIYAPRVDMKSAFVQGLTLLNLRRLDIGFGIEAPEGAIPSSSLVFPHLVHLCVHVYPDDGLVFDRFVAPALLELVIKEYRCSSGNAECFRRSCAQWAKSYPSLETFRVQATCLGAHKERITDARIRRRWSLLDVVAPLLKNTSLQEFCFVWPSGLPPLNVRDEDLIEMARAWPALISLQLDMAGSELPETIEVTPLALSTFAMRCPNLIALDLPYFACRLRDISELDEVPALGHDLEYLTLGRKSIENMALFAKFLDRTFPYLDPWSWAVATAD